MRAQSAAVVKQTVAVPLSTFQIQATAGCAAIGAALFGPGKALCSRRNALQAEAAAAARHAAHMLGAAGAAQRSDELARRAASGPKPSFRPVAVRSLASCGAKKRGPAHSCERPSRSFVEAADYGSALDEGSGTASRARSELEIPASAGGPGRSRHCVAFDAPVHQPSVVPSGAAIAMSEGDDGLRDARLKGPESDRASMHGAQGADPRSRGPEGAAPSWESLVAIFNDARRSLVRQKGGFSLAQGRMIFHRARNCRAEVPSESTSIASNAKLPWGALGCKEL